MRMRTFALMVLFAAGAMIGPIAAQPVSSPPRSTFITLGTTAGPIPNANRAQPANLLRVGDHAILVDVGDGAAQQLARAGVPLEAVATLFISHHHFDHTGGLFALLGMRYQLRIAGRLTIYGPPGTGRLVEGLLSAMAPAAEVGNGTPGALRGRPEAGVEVIEMRDGERVQIGPVAVTAASNSHYSYPAGSPDAARFQSLSFRFDAPDRAIVYTGDTGPSEAIGRLARGADLLVSEVMDPAGAIAEMQAARPDLPAPVLQMIERHFREHHLTPDEAGRLARAAGVRKLVLTHVAPGGRTAESIRAEAAAAFGGDVLVANDLDGF